MSTRVAMVGAGTMAKEHLCAFGDVDGVVLAGIHSRTRAKAVALAERFDIPHICGSVKELYEKTSADLVVVAVPELAAQSVGAACFEHPWGVLMEKPAGYNLQDAETIEAAAQRANRRVWVGLNRRFLASTQAAWRELQSRNEPRFIHIQDQQSLETAKVVGHPPQVVDNWMFANSIHLVDYLTFFGRGDVQSVDVIRPWRGVETQTVLAAVEFTSGDHGIYEGVWHGPGPWAVTVTTASKRWELRPLEQARFQNAGERTMQTIAGHPRDHSFKPGFRWQAEEVVKAVHGEPSQAPTLTEATATMRLIADVFRPGAAATKAA